MSSTKRVVLYGAGRAGRGALTFYRGSHDVIAFADSDYERHGSFVDDVPVIHASYLDALDYEEIIITSMFASDIRRMLTNDYGIAPELISTAPSHISLNSHSPEHDVLAQTLRAISLFLNEHDIDYYLDNSALLSLVRSGDFLPWAHGGVDISLCCPPNKPQDIIELVTTSFDAFEYQTKIVTYEVAYGPWQKGDLKRIILTDTSGRTLTTLSFQYVEGHTAFTLVGPYVIAAPGKFVFETDLMEWNGLGIKVPKNREEYLQYVYGKDWRVPQQNWHWEQMANIVEELIL